MYRIVIIGGGFSGAACALHFLRDHQEAHADIAIVEQGEKLGAGLAYSTPAREHRVNVAASRMSVVPEEPDHFHRWALAQGTPADDPASEMPDGRLYPSRAVFGRYVHAMLLHAAAQHPHSRLRHVRDAATSLATAGSGFQIGLASGKSLEADAVVLAVSHTKPDLPAPLHGLRALVPDPWDVDRLRAIPPGARVLIVGSGLTACDVLATLSAQKHRGPLHVLSRHGLLPRPRTEQPVSAEGEFSIAPEKTALALLRRVRAAVARAQAGSRPWENIIDALRQQAQTVWGALDWEQRRTLLRHLRSFWDVHRFQSSPQIDATVASLRQSGQLHLHAARILSAMEDAQGITLQVLPRGAMAPTPLQADMVIACTGPGHRSVVRTHPVLRGLAQSGGLAADPANLGILVDQSSRVLRSDGTAWPNLLVAGPLARGTFGELMGLPQVNLQPRAVAGELARLVGSA